MRAALAAVSRATPTSAWTELHYCGQMRYPGSLFGGLAMGKDMSEGLSSMTALLAVVAVAGSQHPGESGELLAGHAPAAAAHTAGAGNPQSGLGGLHGNLGNALGGTGAGGFIGTGLRELVEHFQKTGHGDLVQSWVSTGPNREVGPQVLEIALGTNVLAELSDRTGLSKEELLNRLSRDLSSAIDTYTPDGRIPPG